MALHPLVDNQRERHEPSEAMLEALELVHAADERYADTDKVWRAAVVAHAKGSGHRRPDGSIVTRTAADDDVREAAEIRNEAGEKLSAARAKYYAIAAAESRARDAAEYAESLAQRATEVVADRERRFLDRVRRNVAKAS